MSQHTAEFFIHCYQMEVATQGVYDFTPVTDPTFDASPPCGLSQRLRVEPAPMV